MTFVKRRVLVAEDEFLVSLTTIEILESIGCEIVGPAASLATALHLAQSEQLDAAVLDINISGEMIWPIAEALRRRCIPFLFLSAYPRLIVVPESFATVARLEKPLEKTRLLNRLREMWAHPG